LSNHKPIIVFEDALVIVWDRSQIYVLRGTQPKHDEAYVRHVLVNDILNRASFSTSDILDVLEADGDEHYYYQTPQARLMQILFDKLTEALR
jgi:hypothetical protein